MKNHLIILLILFTSCTNSNPESVQLISENAMVKPIEDVIMRCPEGMHFADGRIFIINGCGDHPIQIINPATGEEQWVGRFGDGPDEIASPSSMFSFNHEDDVTLKILDSRKRSIFQLKDTNEGYVLQEEKKIPPVISTWIHFIELEDGSIVYNQASGSYNMSRWLPNGEELFVMDFQPDIGSQSHGMYKAYDYYNDLAVHPKGDKIIQVLHNFPYMVAYNQNLERIEIKQTEDKVPQPDWSNEGVEKFFDLPQYALEVYSSEEYFYVVNPRATYEQTANAQFKPSIDIYNWEMELVASLSLDKMFGGVAIDFSNKKIYGLTFGSEDAVLGEVTIPRSLHQFF
jgi:hypothetical protein